MGDMKSPKEFFFFNFVLSNRILGWKKELV